MHALLAAACSWAVALGSVSVEADAQAAARARQVRVEGAPTRHTGELEATPRIALLRHGRLELGLSYSPRLTLPLDLSAGTPELTSATELRDSGEVLHQGALALDAGATPNLSLRLRGAASYGRIDLMRSAVYAGDVLPTTGRIAWRSAEVSVGATATVSRRTRLEGTVSASEAGGADDAARAVVALRRGVTADASVRHAVSRRDELSLGADATYGRYTPADPAAEAAIVRLGGGIRHLVEETLSIRAAAGAAWSYSDVDPASQTDTAPFVELGLSHVPSRLAVTTDLALRLVPYMNPFTGIVEQRLEATARSSWRASRSWVLAARGAAALTRSETSGGAFWTGERQTELAFLELRASWAFARYGTLSFGPGARRQRSHDPSLPSFSEWGGAVEVAFGARPPE